MPILRSIFAYGPLLFGIGFLAPLIAQVLAALGVLAPLGMSPMVFGLVVGTALGLVAQLRGRWV